MFGAQGFQGFMAFYRLPFLFHFVIVLIRFIIEFFLKNIWFGYSKLSIFFFYRPYFVPYNIFNILKFQVTCTKAIARSLADFSKRQKS